MVIDPTDFEVMDSLADLARKHGMVVDTLRRRVRDQGMKIEKALATPVVRGRHNNGGKVGRQHQRHMDWLRNAAVTPDAKARRAFGLRPGERKHILATGWNPAYGSKRPGVQS